MHFEYNEDTKQLKGWRGSAVMEGPFAYSRVDFKEKAMIEVITPYLEKMRGLAIVKEKK